MQRVCWSRGAERSALGKKRSVNNARDANKVDQYEVIFQKGRKGLKEREFIHNTSRSVVRYRIRASELESESELQAIARRRRAKSVVSCLA